MSEVLTHSQIMEQLPCCDRMVLLDRVAFDGEKKIAGLKSVSMNEWYFQGHFPNHPIVPGVLLVESMAQLAELLVWKKLDPKREGDLYIKSLRKVKFRKPNNPGDRIFFQVEIAEERSDSIDFIATATNNSGAACQAQLTLGIRPKVPMHLPAGFNEFDKSAKSAMDVLGVASVIPHRYPFLFVDYVAKIDGPHVTGIK